MGSNVYLLLGRLRAQPGPTLLGLECMAVPKLYPVRYGNTSDTAGGLIVVWGIITLGRKNTFGLKDGFVLAGPYRFTRNPQYLGSVMIFVGVSLIANSLFLWIAHALLSFVYVLAPIAEESWLEQQYGQAYHEYRRDIPRFFRVL